LFVLIFVTFSAQKKEGRKEILGGRLRQKQCIIRKVRKKEGRKVGRKKKEDLKRLIKVETTHYKEGRMVGRKEGKRS